MASHNGRGHLSSQEIQEFLDRQLAPQEAVSAREHLDSCARCRSEAQAWELLFADLRALPELEPSSGLRQEVLARTATRQPLTRRARGWLPTRQLAKTGEAHVPASNLQDYLEGRLSAGPENRVEAHLADCPACAAEAQEWNTLMESFRGLELLSPGPGFRERVMAQVMVPAPLPVRSTSWFGIPGRLVAWARSMTPDTRQGWAVVGGLASAPTITLAALVYLVFSRPQVTPGALGAYLFWKGSELLQTLMAVVSTFAMENGTFQRVLSFFGSVTQSPLLLGLGGLGLSLVSAAALWVLYRNLIATSSDGRHARARV